MTDDRVTNEVYALTRALEKEIRTRGFKGERTIADLARTVMQHLSDAGYEVRKKSDG